MVTTGHVYSLLPLPFGQRDEIAGSHRVVTIASMQTSLEPVPLYTFADTAVDTPPVTRDEITTKHLKSMRSPSGYLSGA